MTAPTQHNYLTDAIVRLHNEITAELAVVPERPAPLQMLTTKYLADLLMVSPRTVEGWRRDGRGPAVTMVGGMPRYAYQDVVAWILAENGDAIRIRWDWGRLVDEWFEGRPEARAEHEKRVAQLRAERTKAA